VNRLAKASKATAEKMAAESSKQLDAAVAKLPAAQQREFKAAVAPAAQKQQFSAGRRMARRML
jgi:hypothetical protein